MPTTETEICDLLKFYKDFPFGELPAYNTPTVCSVSNKCIELFEKDYNIKPVSNANGALCPSYPPQLLIIESEKQSTKPSSPAKNALTDVQALRKKMWDSRGARCRYRFPVPVIMLEGKYICRSATLSVSKEIYGRTGLSYISLSTEEQKETAAEAAAEESEQDESDSWELTEIVRKQDVSLLRMWKVGSIFDMMLEQKTVRYWMNVASSEKVDKEHRYEGFSLLAVPYPGCEFFRKLRENCYTAENLHFDWNKPSITATVNVYPNEITHAMNVDWENYKTWDLLKLTRNNLQLMQAYIQNRDSGILVHCISGWDRTPLFISLLRLSLWADGRIHKSLSPVEIVYLTLAYDWMLFSHQLHKRLPQGEPVLYYCFYFTQFIEDNDFSVILNKGKPDPKGTEENKASTSEEASPVDPIVEDSPPEPFDTGLLNRSLLDLNRFIAETLPGYELNPAVITPSPPVAKPVPRRPTCKHELEKMAHEDWFDIDPPKPFDNSQMQSKENKKAPQSDSKSSGGSSGLVPEATKRSDSPVFQLNPALTQAEFEKIMAECWNHMSLKDEEDDKDKNWEEIGNDDDDTGESHSQDPQKMNRKAKLRMVRKIFTRCYATQVSFDYMDGSKGPFFRLFK